MTRLLLSIVVMLGLTGAAKASAFDFYGLVVVPERGVFGYSREKAETLDACKDEWSSVVTSRRGRDYAAEVVNAYCLHVTFCENGEQQVQVSWRLKQNSEGIGPDLLAGKCGGPSS